jgi:adenylate cyclase
MSVGVDGSRVMKVRFPLVAKLIGMISLIVVLSMAVVTAVATGFFADDSRVSAEVNTLALNRAVALQMEGEIMAIYKGSLSLLDTLREERTPNQAS